MRRILSRTPDQRLSDPAPGRPKPDQPPRGAANHTKWGAPVRADGGAGRKGAQLNSGFTFQIWSAYSRMVRSDEKVPMPATFMMAWRVQSVGRR